MPIKLLGPWNDGYALDQYTVSSEYIGDDSFGRPQFINTYSEVGKLLHKVCGAETHYRPVVGGSAILLSFSLARLCIFQQWRMIRLHCYKQSIRQTRKYVVSSNAFGEGFRSSPRADTSSFA